jgi:hypothetical protein
MMASEVDAPVLEVAHHALAQPLPPVVPWREVAVGWSKDSAQRGIVAWALVAAARRASVRLVWRGRRMSGCWRDWGLP